MTIILEVQICASTWKGKNFLVLTQPLALQETRFAPALDADIGLSLRNINLVTAYPKSSWKKHNKAVGDARKSSEAKHQQQQKQHKKQQINNNQKNTGLEIGLSGWTLVETHH